MEIEIYWEKPHNTYPIKKTKIYLGNFRINLLMEIGIYWEKQHNTFSHQENKDLLGKL